MRPRGIFTLIKFIIALPLVILTAEALASIPLIAPLIGQGLKLLRIPLDTYDFLLLILALGVFGGLINGSSLGKVVSLLSVMYLAVFIIANSPLMWIAFPSLYTFTKPLREAGTLTVDRGLFYLSLYLAAAIAGDYLDSLSKKDELLERWGMGGDILYAALLNVTLFIALAFALAFALRDYAEGATMHLGEPHMVIPLTLLALGMVIALGVFPRSRPKKVKLVIKLRLPLGERYDVSVSGEEDVVVEVRSEGKTQERELLLEREVERAPNAVRLVYMGEENRSIRLKKVKESPEGNVLFLLYSNERPLEF
ncbi:hypothetical protein [Palaeococcus ferrophilus]|uniref:hypothetical protein n=1 Tax=Palaeococcus ferrophilus TaxID=83868 RepID=UPI00064F0F08|nr:hypothetical protein [Palaeococcus ferrophilus]